MHLYPDGSCSRITGMLPEFPRRTRIYDCLQPEEGNRIAIALDDAENKLTYRSKAIGKLACVRNRDGKEAYIFSDMLLHPV